MMGNASEIIIWVDPSLPPSFSPSLPSSRPPHQRPVQHAFEQLVHPRVKGFQFIQQEGGELVHVLLLLETEGLACVLSQGLRKGGREGRREGGREGRREGRKEGGKEG